MRIRSTHQRLKLAANIHPSEIVLQPISPGATLYEGEVPDAVGKLLLSIGRPGEYIEIKSAAESYAEPEPVKLAAEVSGSAQMSSVESDLDRSDVPPEKSRRRDRR
jgi:hypothetical protein